jgi:epoxyqueuosine reductase
MNRIGNNSGNSQEIGTAALISHNVARTFAVNTGFTEAGVVALPHGEEARVAERFREWVNKGRAGSMEYLKRTNEAGMLVRSRVAAPFPWARSAIVCLASYNSAQPRSIDPAATDAGWIARYAWTSRMNEGGRRVPSDYHKVLLKRLTKLEARLHEEYGAFEARAYVDTGPVVERALATAAGLGWSAKNTCLIHPKIGSYAFLAVLITSLNVEPSERELKVPDRCGSCTRCIQACPTNALDTPYQMDASRCISYLTIEHRGAIAPELMEKMGRQVFGCDICQDVCPWNRKALVAADEELAPRAELVNPALEWLASLDEQQYEREFNGSPVRRARFAGLRRNVAIAMGNAIAVGSGAARFTERLHTWTQAADEGLRAAAAWAIKKLEGRGSTAENR